MSVLFDGPDNSETKGRQFFNRLASVFSLTFCRLQRVILGPEILVSLILIAAYSFDDIISILKPNCSFIGFCMR